jgi:hypothetical protein
MGLRLSVQGLQGCLPWPWLRILTQDGLSVPGSVRESRMNQPAIPAIDQASQPPLFPPPTAVLSECIRLLVRCSRLSSFVSPLSLSILTIVAMGYIRSGITWFDEDVWIERELTFLQQGWKLVRKISETEHLATEEEAQEIHMASESRSVFVVSNVDDQTQEAVVKIRMQYGSLSSCWSHNLLNCFLRVPYLYTAFKTRKARAKQAHPDMSENSQFEICALERLPKAGCSSSPAIMTWKHETQDSDDRVPGGYRDYILMEKLPGSRPSYFPGCMDREERDQLRGAFKKAWL